MDFDLFLHHFATICNLCWNVIRLNLGSVGELSNELKLGNPAWVRGEPKTGVGEPRGPVNYMPSLKKVRTPSGKPGWGKVFRNVVRMNPRLFEHSANMVSKMF